MTWLAENPCSLEETQRGFSNPVCLVLKPKSGISYTICRIRYKMKRWGALVQKWSRISGHKSRASNPVGGPSQSCPWGWPCSSLPIGPVLSIRASLDSVPSFYSLCPGSSSSHLPAALASYLVFLASALSLPTHQPPTIKIIFPENSSNNTLLFRYSLITTLCLTK